MANSVEIKQYLNISATQSPFKLRYGGRYAITVIAASWGGAGSILFQRLAGDGLTYVTVATFTANGFQIVELPSGTYQVVVNLATGVYIEPQSVETTL